MSRFVVSMPSVAAFAFIVLMAAAGYPSRQQNQPPVVTIVNPKNNSVFTPGVAVSYEITVSDKEDGDSKYDEINPKEVLLEIRYVNDKRQLATLLKKDAQTPPGLAAIAASNCFNCHNFNTNAMGPSFFEISKRYPATKANVDTLTKRIRRGSTGIWGKEQMPGHPELSPGAATAAVQWILKYGTDPTLNYLTGLQGQFRPVLLTPPNQHSGGYILTAHYTDHGLKSQPGRQRLEGSNSVVLLVQ